MERRPIRGDMLRTLLMFATMGASLNQTHRETYAISTEDWNAYTKRKEQMLQQMMLERGAKEWTIDGITVIVRNEKNALRKVNNIKQQLNNL